VTAAISRALADARVDPTQVVHVNAHATSTPEGDALEAQALVKALGSAVDGVIVTSTKSMTGHLLGGAGAIESVAAILALREHVAPPTINLEDLDDDVPVEVATEPRPLSKRGSEPMAVVNNAFGFGGHNVSLVFTAA
jgi:3-oxoacyl-[acyl-carrier-protein] synthase II